MAVATRSGLDPRTAGGIMKSTGQMGSPPHAATLERQVNLFQDLYRRRDHQYAHMLAKAHEFTEEADDGEMELVFAMDRAEFAESQLSRLLESAPQTYKVQAQRVSEFQRSARAVANHLAREDDIHERHEQSAWLISRLRLLRMLCQFSEERSGIDADRTLGNSLQQCEDKLRGACTDTIIEPLIADVSVASPLAPVCTFLCQKTSVEDAATGWAAEAKQEQFLLPASRSPKQQVVTAEEDLQLQREIEELADRNEALRKELLKESQSHGACEAKARLAADVEAEAAKESEVLQHHNRNLAEERSELQQEVARLQAELPQLESQAAPVRLQLGCERSTVAAHREEISRCRAAVPALTEKLRKLALPDSASSARQAALLALRHELAETYAALATAVVLHEADSPQTSYEQSSGSQMSPHGTAALESRREAARDENVRLKQAVELRNGSMQGQAKQLESRNDLIKKTAKNSKEIADLKERLRREELQEERLSVRRQEVRSRSSSNLLKERSPTPTSSQSSQGSGSHRAPTGIAGVTAATASSCSVVVANPAEGGPTHTTSGMPLAVQSGPAHTTSGMPMAVPVVPALPASSVAATQATPARAAGVSSISPSAWAYAQRYGNSSVSPPSAFDAAALEMRPSASKPLSSSSGKS